jgi:nucleotide-binding universal stress UspA family protein
MRNFVVPVDFSAESLNGLKMAMLFSQKEQVSIQMMYVLHKTSDSEKAAMEAETALAENNFTNLVKEYSPRLGHDSKLGYLISKGRIYHEVVHQAELYPDSIITASTHGASGFQELFIGSNAFKIISATERPVIAIRKSECPASIGRIVMPIDLSVDSRQKVPFTTEIARLFGAEVHVVGVQTSRGLLARRKVRSYASQVAGFVQASVPCVTNEVSGDSVAEMVVNYANAVKADMISITTEKPSGLSLIIGNTAHQILNKAEIPVLCHTPKSIRKSGTFVTTGG